MQRYHDAEWGVPVRDGRALWEALMLEGFQAGLSWAVILGKRAALRRAFAGFDPVSVAGFGAAEVARLVLDPGIVRSRAKIEATIRGARVYCAMAAAGEDFAALCWGFTGGRVLRGAEVGSGATQTAVSAAASAVLKRRGFGFCGPVTTHAWMQAVGMVDDHQPGCFRCGAGGG